MYTSNFHLQFKNKFILAGRVNLSINKERNKTHLELDHLSLALLLSSHLKVLGSFDGNINKYFYH